MKKNIFYEILILCIIVILGSIGYYVYTVMNLPNKTKQLLKYENKTYGIEFQYNKDSKIVYEVTDGNEPVDNGVIVTLKDESLKIIKDGNEYLDDTNYFTLELMKGGCPDSNDPNTQSIKNSNGLAFQYKETSGELGLARGACIINGDKNWYFSNTTTYSENSKKTGELFNQILMSFNFTVSEEKTDPSITETEITNDQKTTIDVKETSEKVGTIVLGQGWQVIASNNEGQEMIGEPTRKTIDIEKGEYAIHIYSFGSGKAVCGDSGTGQRDSLIGNGYANFKDQDGHEYFRQISASISNELSVCSNTYPNTPDIFNEDSAVFGNINYKIPVNPDISILNEMDDMIASFKTSL
jgi:hypothetical protein